MAGLAAELTGAESEIVLGLDSGIRPLALRHRQAVVAAGIPYTFSSGRRSRGHQDRIYRDYIADMEEWRQGDQRGDQPRPVAKPGSSKHNLGMAWDFVGPRTNPEWQKAGELAEALGLESGHRYNDPGHVEQPDTLAMLREAANIKMGALLAVMGLAWAIAKEG